MRGSVSFLAIYPAGVLPAKPSEPVETPADPAGLAAIPSLDLAIGSALAGFVSNPSRISAPPRFVQTRPPPLVPLYATFAVLQVADAWTTVKALRTPGLREANPIIRPIARNPAAMVVVKSASTAVTVIAVEKLWKRNRTAAVATMVGINAAYGVIVSKNAARIP